AAIRTDMNATDAALRGDLTALTNKAKADSTAVHTALVDTAAAIRTDMNATDAALRGDLTALTNKEKSDSTAVHTALVDTAAAIRTDLNAADAALRNDLKSLTNKSKADSTAVHTALVDTAAAIRTDMNAADAALRSDLTALTNKTNADSMAVHNALIDTAAAIRTDMNAADAALRSNLTALAEKEKADSAVVHHALVDTAADIRADMNNLRSSMTLAAVMANGNSAATMPITNLADPTYDQDAATKKYVDSWIFSLADALEAYVDEKVGKLQQKVDSLTDIVDKLMFAGSGTFEDPYLISNVKDLLLFSQVASTPQYIDKVFQVTADIDYDSPFTPISRFEGYLDGAGHHINLSQGFAVPDEAPYNIGLFQDASYAWIQDLRIIGASTVAVNTPEDVNVGVFSANGMGYIYGCNSYMSLYITNEGSGTVYAGGIVARTPDNSEIYSSSFTDTISVEADNAYIGGLVGYVGGEWTDILNCAFTDGELRADVSGTAYIGGLVGYQSTMTAQASIMNCYVSGTIYRDNSNTTVGGFIAKKNGAWDYNDIMFCFLHKKAMIEYDAVGDSNRYRPCYWENAYGSATSYNRFVDYDTTGRYQLIHVYDTIDSVWVNNYDNWSDWMGWKMYVSPMATSTSLMTIDGENYYATPRGILTAVMNYFELYEDASLWAEYREYNRDVDMASSAIRGDSMDTGMATMGLSISERMRDQISRYIYQEYFYHLRLDFIGDKTGSNSILN
ncbi:MAG: hypothetical protein IJ620_05410, partial [Bacteroidales bacterium]|nr:hypothetical protein [Bacteroidales bacterium]